MSAPSDWLVDLGHSRIKWAQTRDGVLIEDSADAGSVDALDAFEQVVEDQTGRRLWLSGQSNSEIVTEVTALIDRHGLSLHAVRTGEINLPVRPAYPALGSDRWLAMQWPHLQSNGPVCVIDCGTAVTVDVVDDKGIHLGGWIMAGLGILCAGLQEKARGLPRVSDRADTDAGQADIPATDSATAIARGILLQLVGAIDRSISASAGSLGKVPDIWLTGGDGYLVMNELSRECQFDPHLVLRGLALAAQKA